MKTKITNFVEVETGFTLVEILISVSILMIFLVSIYSVYATSQGLLHTGLGQSKAVADARTAIERVERAIRGCKSATVSQGGNRLDLVEDANHNPNNQNNVSKAIYYNSGDGGDNTYNDNRLFYDPNTALAGNEVTVTTNIARQGAAVSFFSVNNGVVTVNFSVKYTSPVAPTQSADVSTDIKLRN